MTESGKDMQLSTPIDIHWTEKHIAKHSIGKMSGAKYKADATSLTFHIPQRMDVTTEDASAAKPSGMIMLIHSKTFGRHMIMAVNVMTKARIPVPEPHITTRIKEWFGIREIVVRAPRENNRGKMTTTKDKTETEKPPTTKLNSTRCLCFTLGVETNELS